jgi:hypothetical protein
VEEVDLHVLVYPRMDGGQYLILQKLGFFVTNVPDLAAQFKLCLRPNFYYVLGEMAVRFFKPLEQAPLFLWQGTDVEALIWVVVHG